MTNGLPVGLPLLCRRPIKKMIFFHYPRVSPGAAPLTKKPEDSGYEIDSVPTLISKNGFFDPNFPKGKANQSEYTIARDLLFALLWDVL